MRESFIEWAIRVMDGDRVHIIRCSGEEQANTASGQYEGVPVSREVTVTQWQAARV